MKNKILLLVATLISSFQFAQNVDVTFDTDDCLNILPKAGTYTLDGQENGKNKYILGPNLKIIWSDTNNRWELQEYYDNTWTTAFYSEKTSITPPTQCWNSDICSNMPVLSGNDAFPTINYNTFPTILITAETSSTVTYTITFDNTLNNLTASNFSLPTTGNIITNIASVTQDTNDDKIWHVEIYWSGEGSLQLNLTNDMGTSALIACSEIRGENYNTFLADDTLAPGDIAFTGYNSYPYSTSPPFSADFSFVVLKNGGIPAGTELFFTDSGFNNNTSNLTNIEGGFILRFNDPVNQYDQIRVTIPQLYYDPYIAYLPTGTATIYKYGINNMALTQSGDQIFIFQGSTKNPKFVTGIHMNTETTSTLTAWDNYTTSSVKSALPSELTNGLNAVMVVDGANPPYIEFDNASFNYSGKTLSQINTTTINDRSEWIKGNGSSTRITPPVFNYATVLSNNNFELENKITIYPNPINSVLNISFKELIPRTATITDLNGRKLISYKLRNTNNVLDLNEFAKGIYILQIDTEEGKLNKQIIIE